MENLIICVGIFYILHLFLTMSLSLHKVPFVNWTYTGGDISGMTELSARMASASDNLRQSLPLFLTFAVLSVVMGMGEVNLMLAKVWLGLRIAYLVGAAMDLYSIPMIRPLIWLPSIESAVEVTKLYKAYINISVVTSWIDIRFFRNKLFILCNVAF